MSRGPMAASLLILLFLSVVGSAYVAWNIESELGLHGWLALGLGVVFTLLLAGGLIWLMHFSRSRGFDDDAGHF